MKKKLILLVVLVFVILLAAGGYFFFRGDQDEKIINENLARLVELAEKEGDESVFVTLGQSREMMRYIGSTPDVEVGSPLPVLTDREELEGVLIQVRQSMQSLSIRVVRKALTIAEDGQSAQMELEVEGNVAYFGDSGAERRRFAIGWIKEEGDWLIQAVRLEGKVD